MSIAFATLLIYIALSLFITFWSGRILFRCGRVFLVEAFQTEEMADSINTLLLVGFYLVNFGIVSIFVAMGYKPDNWLESVEYLGTKVGVVLLILGGMHYFNMKNIAKVRSRELRRARDEYRPEPGSPELFS